MSLTELPGELLLDIFELAAGGGHLRMNDAIAFSHINRSCRHFALNTPYLWTVLSAHLGAECATIFAGRAQTLGLDIRINSYRAYSVTFDPFGDRSRSTDNLAEFMDAVSPHFGRWYRLVIDVGSEETFRLIHDYIDGEWRSAHIDALNVDAVVLRVDRIVNPKQKLDYKAFKPVAFVPRSLELDGVPAWENKLFSSRLEHLVLRNLAAPFYALRTDPRSVQGGTPYLSDLSTMLHKSPNLRQLVLDGSGPRDDDTTVTTIVQDERIVMAKLHAVSLTWVHAPMAYKLVSMISMPALRSLHLHVVHTGDFAWRALAELRHPAPLEELHLRISSTPADTPARRDVPFARFENLRTLELDDTGIDDSVLRELIALPKLRHLALRFERFITADATRECVRSRLDLENDRRVCAITYLEVVHCPNLTPDDETFFEELVPNLVWNAYEEEEEGDSAYIPYGSESDDDGPEYSSDSDDDAEISDGEALSLHAGYKNIEVVQF